jgi:L-lysine exporter family protein LysE/ArgO
MAEFWRGAFLCGSLVMTIGAQVSYVLRQGILRAHVGKVVAVCIASDIAFIVAGIAGAAILVQQYDWLVRLLVYLGAAYLTWFGLLALRRAWRGGRVMSVGAMTAAAAPAGTISQGTGAAVTRSMIEPAGKVVLTIAALTWLNPHVYVDAILILGGAGAKLAPELRGYFIAGAILADIICFSALGYGARLLAPLFAKPTAWRVLDLLVGVIVLAIAATQLR